MNNPSYWLWLILWPLFAFLTISLNSSAKEDGKETTKEDLEKVTLLSLVDNKLTEVPKELEKLTKLEGLNLQYNPDLTKAQIDELQKALPNCTILSDFE